MRSRRKSQKPVIDIGEVVFQLRKFKNISGSELCRRSPGLDPKTLNAVEKGRIKNPSIATLQLLARGLGIPISAIFRKAESDVEGYFYLGSQKGYHQTQFSHWNAKFVSFTPPIADFFCGKFILGPKGKLGPSLLRHASPIYLAVMVGRLEGEIEGRPFSLKEGDNIFFHGALKYFLFNPLGRESVYWMTTAPSFL